MMTLYFHIEWGKLLLNKENKQLLRHYEHSLPSWSVVMATYLVYRPSFRKFQYWLMMFLSIATMMIGFFDLYKNIPFFRSFIFYYMDSIWDWLDDHLMFRMTFLLGYIISGSSTAFNIILFLTDLIRDYPLYGIFYILKSFSDLFSSIKRLLNSLKYLIYAQHEVQVTTQAVGFAANAIFSWGVFSIRSVFFSFKAVYNTFVYIGWEIGKYRYICLS